MNVSENIDKNTIMSVEIDEDLYARAEEFCSEHGITIEHLLCEFLIFASKEENIPELEKFLGIS